MAPINNVVGPGVRGATWVTAHPVQADETARPSATARTLQARFSSDVNNQGRDGTLPVPLSQPLRLLPPSKPPYDALAPSGLAGWNSIERDSVPHAAVPFSEDLSWAAARSLEHRLVAGGSNDRPSGPKIIVAPYRTDTDAVLIISVGGPNDDTIFISTMEPPEKPANRRRKHKPLPKAKEAVIRTSALPSFVSASPITSIKLAPSQPDMSFSAAHQGPWLSIQTLTETHLVAVHQPFLRPYGSSDGSASPAFVLTQIASFLTPMAGVLRQSNAGDIRKGPTFLLSSHPIADVAWDPARRTSALIVDVVGNVWRWSVDFISGDVRWLSHGQHLVKVLVSPLTQQEIQSNKHCQISWVDDLAADNAIVMTDHALFGLDLGSGSAERLYELSTIIPHLQRPTFLSATHTGLPHALMPALDSHASPPLLLVVSSTCVHVLDAINPRRELLVLAHHRAFDDPTLRTVWTDATTTDEEEEDGRIRFLLVSDRDATTTIYTIGCAISIRADARRQVTRAWQASQPAELPRLPGCEHGGDSILLQWKRFVPGSRRWTRWRHAARELLGRWAHFRRLEDGSTWLQSFTKLGSRLRRNTELPFVSHSTPGAHELATLMRVYQGLIADQQVAPRTSSGAIGAIRTIDFSQVYEHLQSLQHVAHQISSSTPFADFLRVADALTKNIPATLQATVLTGLDLLVLSSLDTRDARQLIPFADPQGAVSALYAPNTLPHLGRYSGCAAMLLSTVAAAMGKARASGSGWWDGERVEPALLLGPLSAVDSSARAGIAQDASTHQATEPDLDGDTRARDAEKWERQVATITESYVGTPSSSITSDAFRVTYNATLQIVLQLALSNEVWSSRPVTVQDPQPTSFLEKQPDAASWSLTSDLTQPERWRTLSDSQNKRSRRQDSVFSQPLSQTSSKRRRRDSVAPESGRGEEVDGDESREEMLAENISRLGPSTATDVDGSDDVDIETLAKTQLPEPEEVHFSFFQPVEHVGGSSVTTRAARLLLSTWPMTSVDPECPENDPSFFTYSDPYVLLDGARAAAEGGYASTSGMSATDGESTGWSSAWTSDTSNWYTSGGETSDGMARARSHSVWSGPSSTGPQGTHLPGLPVASASTAGLSQSQPPTLSAGAAEFHRRRRMAPPSISSSSQRATSVASSSTRTPAPAPAATASPAATPARTSYSQQHPLADSQLPLSQQMGWSGDGAETQSPTMARASPSMQASALSGAATQPVPGLHGSRRKGDKTAKKPKKRLDGF
ncbi:unnamed protein product [Parajaminaea phylloscopi]